MPEPSPTFTQRRQSHQRFLHVMTKENQIDVMPLEDGGQLIYIDEAYTAAQTALLLAQMVRLARTSSVSRHLLAETLSIARQAGDLTSDDQKAAAKLRQHLRIAVGIDTSMFRSYFPEHRFHPDILLGCEAIDTVDVYAASLPREKRMLELLRTILRLGNKPAYVEARSRHRKATGKRVRATKDYINAIFKTCARQLVVRVDLGYARHDAVDGQGTVRSGLTFAQVNKHRERLEKAMRSAWGSALCGFVMRLEWAPHKTYHFHLMVFLNNYKLQGRTSHAKKIGRMWNKATFGLGKSWEPKAHEGETRGTGVFHRDKPEQMPGLIKAATYLCKSDHYIGYYKGERDKTFFRGNFR